MNRPHRKGFEKLTTSNTAGLHTLRLRILKIAKDFEKIIILMYALQSIDHPHNKFSSSAP
jgi:hypothetical protein